MSDPQPPSSAWSALPRPRREGPHLSINVCPSSCSTISSGKCEDLRWQQGQSQNPRGFPKCHTHLATSGSKSTNYQLQRLREHSALKMYPQSPESSSQERPDVLRLSSVHPEPEGPALWRSMLYKAKQSTCLGRAFSPAATSKLCGLKRYS